MIWWRLSGGKRTFRTLASGASARTHRDLIRETSLKRFYIVWAALLSLFGSAGAFAQDGQPASYVVADVLVIHSKILGEDRKLFIYNPDNVGGNVLPAYPVLYLLEENDMPMVAGMVKYLSSYNEQLPAMLVVGIDGGGQRIRDLTPTHSLYDNMGKLDTDPQSWLQPSGGGDKFLRFVREEVMPFVEQRYRTAPFRIIAGHSVGGLIAIHALATQPDLFNAYLAVSPSLWWDKGTYLDRAIERLSASPSAKEFLFVADSPETGPFPVYMKRFLGTLSARKAQGFSWAHAFYPNETHGSIAAKAYYDGLRFLFPQWNVEEANPTAESIRAHYRKMSDRLGYDVQPPFGLVTDWGDGLLRRGKFADAIAVYRINVTNFPTNAAAHGQLGDAYLRKGDRASAMASYRRAVELAPEDKELKARLDSARK